MRLFQRMLLCFVRSTTPARVRRANQRANAERQLRLDAEQQAIDTCHALQRNHAQRELETARAWVSRFTELAEAHASECGERQAAFEAELAENKGKYDAETERLGRLVESYVDTIRRHESTLAVKEHEIKLMAQVAARDFTRRRAETAMEAVRVALATSGKIEGMAEIEKMLNGLSPNPASGN